MKLGTVLVVIGVGLAIVAVAVPERISTRVLGASVALIGLGVLLGTEVVID